MTVTKGMTTKQLTTGYCRTHRHVV